MARPLCTRKAFGERSKIVLLAALLFVFAIGFAFGFASTLGSQKPVDCQKCASLASPSCPAAQCPTQPTASSTPSASLAPLPEQTLSASLRVLAVRGDTGQGAVGNVTVEIRPGKGRVLVNTNPFVEPDTQQSADTAARYAAAFTRKSISDRDVIFSFESPGQLVGGPSAGAAMAIAAIAALSEKQPRRDVAVSGTVDAEGKIGFVGGLIEKSEAAAVDGVKLFLVPKGQEILSYYREKQEEQRRGNFVIIRTYYEPVLLDLNAYTTGEFNMTTRGVATIAEAAKEFFG